MKVLVDGLRFPEGPRWHEGRLFFSDFYTHTVHSLTDDGELSMVATVPGQPSGLGWLPDGRLLIVSMTDRKLLRQEADGVLAEHADLGAIATFHCNDMVVDAAGNAYVGNFGFDTHGDPVEPMQANLAVVRPDGTASIAAPDLDFPNGTVITPEGSTLIIAESRARRLTAFDRAEDGTLSNRRVWADLGEHVPDGICLDAEGAIWVADPRGNCVIRVQQGGTILRTETLDRGAFACMLGGEHGNRLYVCSATGSGPHAEARRDGRIEFIDVDVPRAGLP